MGSRQVCRIVEWLKVEGTSMITQFQPSLMDRVAKVVCLSVGGRVLSWVEVWNSTYFVCSPSIWNLGTNWLSSGRFDIWFLLSSVTKKSGTTHRSLDLMNHCKCLICWQLHATQLHILFCCHNFNKILELCSPTQKKPSKSNPKYSEIWELICNPPPVYLYQVFG